MINLEKGNNKSKGGSYGMRKKLSRKSLITGVLLVTVLYMMLTSTVFAGSVSSTFGDTGITVTGSVNGSWDVFSTTSNAITGSLAPEDSDNSSTSVDYSKSRTDTITVKNESTEVKTVSFTYQMTTSDQGSVSVDGGAAVKGNTVSNFSKTLDPDGSFTIVLTSGTGTAESYGTVSITNFKAETVQVVTVTLAVPQNGSYTASSGDESVTMTPTSTAQSFSFVSSDGITLSNPVASDGYKFDRWEKEDGTSTSYADSETFVGVYAAGDTVVPSFLPKLYNRVYNVGTDKYYSWQEAVEASVSSGKAMVLNDTDYTLPGTKDAAIAAGETVSPEGTENGYVQEISGGLRYIVPKDCKFVIPYESTLSYNDDDRVFANPVQGKPAYQLTVNAGTEIVVRNGGTFMINAKRACKQPYMGCTTGNYGKLVLGGTMTVESGGFLNVRGYIADTIHDHEYAQGSGRLYVDSGATVQTLFQILDFRGGQATAMTAGYLSSGDKILPITSYYVTNILMYAEYEQGAKLDLSYLLYMSDDFLPGVARLIDSADTTANVLFKMGNNGRIAMDYNYDVDQMQIVVQMGSITIDNLQIQTSWSGIPIDIQSKAMVLPIPDNLQVYIGDPNITYAEGAGVVGTVSSPLKFLPGAGIYVQENCTLDISSALYLFANANYKAEWGMSVYRSALAIAENPKGCNASALGVYKAASHPAVYNAIHKDAAIYNKGTVDIKSSGTLLQSGAATEDTSAKTNRVIPMSESARMIVGKIATSGQVRELKGTDGSGGKEYYKDWTAINGLFVGSDEYQTFPGTGTYKATLEDDVYKWYNYSAAYTFQDAEGNDITDQLTVDQNPVFIAGSTSTFDVSSITSGKYVITGCTVSDTAVTVAAGEDEVNADSITKGWETLTLGNITQDIEVTLTVVPYDHRVTWSETQGGTTSTWTEYIVGHEATREWEGSARVVVNSATPADKLTKNDAEVLTENGVTKTVLRITGIAQDQVDVAIDLTVDMDYWRVDWNVTYPGSSEPVVKTDWIKKGESAVYTVESPESGHHIIEDGAYTITGSDGTEVTNDKTSLTLHEISGSTKVDITVSYYAHKVQFSMSDNVAGENLSLDPVYIKESGGSATVQNTALKNAAGQLLSNYVFGTAEPSETDTNSVSVGLTYTELTVANVTADCTVNVTMRYYDYTVTIQDAGSEVLLKEYVTADPIDPIVYTFGSGIRINSIAVNNDAVVAYTDAAADSQDPSKTVPAVVTIGSVPSDTLVTVDTSTFQHILTILDQDGNELLKDYVDGTSKTYRCQNDDQGRYIVTGASVTEGTGTATLNYGAKESIEISDMTGNPTVVLTLQAYSNKVTWRITGTGNTTTTVDYLTDGRTTSTYDAPDRYIIADRSASTVSQGSVTSTHTYATDTLKQIAYANINLDMIVTVTLAPYDYEVTIKDGISEPKVYYVDKDAPDEEVTYGDALTYTAPEKKYFSAITQTGTATVDGSANTNQDVANGWEEFVITGVQSDVTIDLTLAAFDHKVTWKVTTSKGGVPETTTQVNFITGDTDSWYVGDDINIQKATPSVTGVTATISDDLHTVTVSGITSNVTVTVNAQDFLFNIIWNVTKDGETTSFTQGVKADDIQADGTVLWTMPDYGTEKSYVIGNVTVGYGKVANRTNTTLSVCRTDSEQPTVTVSISIEEALDTYTALWGRMSYKYYKNGAYYAWDGEAYVWRLINTYAWTNTPGGRVEKYWDLNTNEETPYFIPNGSVMIVNPTNVIITATVTVDNTNAPWCTTTLKAEDGTTGTGTITVTLQPRSTMIISGILSGDPLDADGNILEMEDLEIGTWSVNITPTN